jgi:hypothetical protein
MPELIRSLKRNAADERGSVLVTAVVLSIIMAIAGIGFIWLSTNILNNDSAALQNDKAFHAAESGALIGCKWLLINDPTLWLATWTSQSSSFQNLKINGLEVDVSISFNSDTATVSSAVFSGSTHNATTFLKRIKMTVKETI